MEENLRIRLQEFRKYNKISQEELSERLKVSRQTIINWENGESSPSIDYMIELSKIYNVSMDELLDTSKTVEEIYNKEKKEEDSSFKQEEKIEDKPFIEISDRGIFINGKRKGDSDVSISDDGIIIDGKEVTSNYKKFCDKTDKRKFIKKVANFLDGILLLLCLVTYIVLGVIDTNFFTILWPIFFTPFIISGFVRTIGLRKYESFPIVFIVLCTYFFLGVLLPNNTGWHPYWVIFFLIPIYYIVGSSIKSLVNERRNLKEKEKNNNVIDNE